MNGLLAALLLSALPALALATSGGDPIDSPDCRSARVELERAINEPPPWRGQRLERARRHAADICLGRASAHPQRSGAPDPAQVVPPPVFSPPRPAALPRIAMPAAPLAIPRPAAITACDPAGCWDSEGRRLNQMGPQLVGPRGVCSVQGGLVTCP